MTGSGHPALDQTVIDYRTPCCIHSLNRIGHNSTHREPGTRVP